MGKVAQDLAVAERTRDAVPSFVARCDIHAGESERDFRIRLQLEARTARDEAVDAVRKKYAPKQAALAERLRRAEQAVERETQQASDQKMQTAVSVGATLLALFGRKAVRRDHRAGDDGRARGPQHEGSVRHQAGVRERREVKAAIAALDGEIAEDVAAVSARSSTTRRSNRCRSRPSAGRSRSSSSRWRGSLKGRYRPGHDRRPGPPRRPVGGRRRGAVRARSARRLPVAGARAGPPRDRHQRARAAPGPGRAALPLRQGSIRFASSATPAAATAGSRKSPTRWWRGAPASRSRSC